MSIAQTDNNNLPLFIWIWIVFCVLFVFDVLLVQNERIWRCLRPTGIEVPRFSFPVSLAFVPVLHTTKHVKRKVFGAPKNKMNPTKNLFPFRYHHLLRSFSSFTLFFCLSFALPFLCVRKNAQRVFMFIVKTFQMLNEVNETMHTKIIFYEQENFLRIFFLPLFLFFPFYHFLFIYLTLYFLCVCALCSLCTLCSCSIIPFNFYYQWKTKTRILSYTYKHICI